jgi:hypothetical protein
MAVARLLCFGFVMLVPSLLGQSSPASPIFAPAVIYGSGGYKAVLSPSSLAMADVNGDGKPDLIVANYCASNDTGTNYCGLGGSIPGSVGVLLGNGDGTFRAAVSYDSGGYGAYSVAVADVNGDGKPDLLVVNYCSSNSCVEGYFFSPGSVGVLLGNGDGTFQPAVTYGSGGYNAASVAVADVNDDGKPDLIVANVCSSTNGAGNCEISGGVNGDVGVLLGNGDGTFQPALTYGSGGEDYASAFVAAADVNGDGKADLIVANQCASSSNCSNGTIGILLGNGDGTFQPALTYGSGGQDPLSLAVGDVNRDGKPDLLVANVCGSNCQIPNGTTSVLLGNGDGTFQVAVNYESGGYFAESVAVGDVNGDGVLDMLVANTCSTLISNNCEGEGTLGVLLGNGDGTFQTAVAYSSGGENTSSVVVADVNGDGATDAMVSNENGIGVLVNIPKAKIGGSVQQPLTRDGEGNYVAQVTITNNSNVIVTSLQVTISGSTLGSGSLVSASPAVMNLAIGASANITLKFPPTSILPNAKAATLRVGGNYSASNPPVRGNWALSFRSVTL